MLTFPRSCQSTADWACLRPHLEVHDSCPSLPSFEPDASICPQQTSCRSHPPCSWICLKVSQLQCSTLQLPEVPVAARQLHGPERHCSTRLLTLNPPAALTICLMTLWVKARVWQLVGPQIFRHLSGSALYSRGAEVLTTTFTFTRCEGQVSR